MLLIGHHCPAREHRHTPEGVVVQLPPAIDHVIDEILAPLARAQPSQVCAMVDVVRVQQFVKQLQFTLTNRFLVETSHDFLVLFDR